jgi:hypothetical protein
VTEIIFSDFIFLFEDNHVSVAINSEQCSFHNNSETNLGPSAINCPRSVRNFLTERALIFFISFLLSMRAIVILKLIQSKFFFLINLA